MGYYEPYKPYEIKPITEKTIEKITPYFLFSFIASFDIYEDDRCERSHCCELKDRTKKFRRKFTKEEFDEIGNDIYHDAWENFHDNKNGFKKFMKKYGGYFSARLYIEDKCRECYLNPTCYIDDISCTYIDEDGNKHEVDVNEEWYEGCEEDNDWICDKICAGCSNYLYCRDETDHSANAIKIRVKPDNFYN
jgi:hypothetical protein